MEDRGVVRPQSRSDQAREQVPLVMSLVSMPS